MSKRRKEINLRNPNPASFAEKWGAGLVGSRGCHREKEPYAGGYASDGSSVARLSRSGRFGKQPRGVAVTSHPSPVTLLKRPTGDKCRLVAKVFKPGPISRKKSRIQKPGINFFCGLPARLGRNPCALRQHRTRYRTWHATW